MTFTETLHLLITGRKPAVEQARVLDCILVTLMDHGATPHAMVAQLTYCAAPGRPFATRERQESRRPSFRRSVRIA
jgi:hypothetical protein